MTQDPVPPSAPRGPARAVALDPERAEMRLLVASIARRLDELTRATPTDTAAADAAADFAALVGLMRLGPEPEVRICPTCGNVGMRLASRCGYCWNALPKPADAVRAEP